MSGFPGLQSGIDGDPYLDPENLTDTITDICANGAKLLVLLTEEDELPSGAFEFVAQAANDANLDLAFLPIPDFGCPDAATMDQWHTLAASRDDMPGAAGGAIAFACQHGAGRSGTMAAYVLMQHGLNSDAAIHKVRNHFSEAIESSAQVDWLENMGAPA